VEADTSQLRNRSNIEALTVVIRKRTVARDVTPCNLVEVYRRFGRTYCLSLQSRRVNRANEYASAE
jgi:hypothetical protein